MTTTTAPAPSRQSALTRFARTVDRYGLWVYTFLAVGYLLVPIVVMIVFSFNKPDGKFNFVWKEFSIDAWLSPLTRPGLADALGTSLIVAFLATLAATALGTLIALALVRYQFRGRTGASLFIFIPMATPEIVMGASLLTLFVGTASDEPWRSIIPAGVFYPLGFNTILIAHILFLISFVVVTVRARISGFDRRLEEAAMDLGANEWTTFWRVTFPLIFPGILAASLLAFSLSIDDFIVTNFTSGLTNTFPVWIWGTIRNNLPVQVNVIGTIIFLTAVGVVLFGTLWSRRHDLREQRLAQAPRQEGAEG
ncbi:MAG TPA: ABC transporter permease [Candidatus Limnocylindrales bacterium]|nr:ABC transporter permease [Candidatus Limnocylindrales bacterium]